MALFSKLFRKDDATPSSSVPDQTIEKITRLISDDVKLIEEHFDLKFYKEGENSYASEISINNIKHKIVISDGLGYSFIQFFSETNGSISFHFGYEKAIWSDDIEEEGGQCIVFSGTAGHLCLSKNEDYQIFISAYGSYMKNAHGK